MNNYQNIIIGAGACGLMLASLLNNPSTLLLDSNKIIGKKLRITGNGRCNLLPVCDFNTFKEKVHNAKFLSSAFHKFDVKNHFIKNGLKLKCEGQKYYPSSEKAIDVINFFQIEQVKLLLDHKVSDLIIENNQIIGCVANNQKFFAKNIVICSGGITYPQTGSDSSMNQILKRYGFKFTKFYPSEVAIAIDGFKHLAGISLEKVRIYHQKYSKEGSLLFTHKGLSGYAALSFGEYLARKPQITAYIDFISDYQVEDLLTKVWNQRDYLSTLFPKKLYQFLLEDLDINNCGKKELRKLLLKLKTYPLNNAQSLGMEKAFVTSGGLNLKEINPQNLSHKKYSNLYFGGEILDLHGEIGGYNLLIAWLCAFIIADALK